MADTNNANVNVFNRKPIVVNNDNVDKIARSKQIDEMVEILKNGLKAQDDSKPFLAKACWRLPESVVWNNYESALKGKNPMGLFIWLCKKSGV